MNQYKLMSGKQKRLISGLISLFAVLFVMGALVLEQYYRYEVSNFESRDETSHAYYIYPGATLDSVAAVLREDYDLASETDWQLHKRRFEVLSVKPGFYRFPPRIGDRQLLHRLKNGEQTEVRLTFTNEMRTREQLAGKLSSYLLIDSLDILERLNSDEYMAQYGLNKETSRCLFLPDTYYVYWTISADELFERMQKEHKRFWNAERLAKAEALNLSPAEIQIVASIVECETNKRSEYPLIASLYLNRVHRGMHLQACPSVKYAVGNFKLRRILNSHLAVDNPYNTYKYPGLPPGPLRCCNKTTIDDVLDAPKTDYLFMCANPDFSGTHIFSSSYGSHTQAAVAYRHNLDVREAERREQERLAAKHLADSLAQVNK